MFFSLYYMTSMLWQWLRQRPMMTSITGHLVDTVKGTRKDASISFYRLDDQESDELIDFRASSSLVSNAATARIRDIIFHQRNYRGCVLMPMQKVDLTNWITFPKETLLVPTTFDNNTLVSLDEDRLICLLIEVNCTPNPFEDGLEDFIQFQHFGVPICWRVGSLMSFIVQSDFKNLSRLLTSTFVDGKYLMNDNLLLNRIETVGVFNVPRTFEAIQLQLNCPIRDSSSLDDWNKHLQVLKNMVQHINPIAAVQVENTVAPDIIPVPHRSGSFRSNGSTDTVRSVSPREPSFEQFLDETETNKPSPNGVVPLKSPAKKNENVAAPRGEFLVNEVERKPKMDFKIKSVSSAEPKIIPAIAKEMKSDQKVTKNTLKKGISFAVEEKKEAEKVKEENTKKMIVESATASVNSVLEAAINEIESKKMIEAEKKAVQDVVVQIKIEDPKDQVDKVNTPTENTSKSPKTKQTVVVKTTPKPIELPTLSSTDSGTDSPTLIQRKPSGSTKKKIEKQKKVEDHKHLPTNDLFKRLPAKPMNVLVYSESSSIRTDVIETLSSILEPDRYTVYPLNVQQSRNGHFISNCSLLIVCGDVSDNKQASELFAEFFIKGGQLLCICSDVLHHILPTYRTAEIRENELVQFSYKKWQRVKMMHHVFCYQPSPVRKHFSQDSQESDTSLNNKGRSMEKSQMPMCPRSIDVKDNEGNSHCLLVEVLGKEETWNTPSLITARNKSNSGVAIFSQIHLETNPSQYEFDSNKYSVLQKSEKIRLEILSDLLATHFNVQVTSKPALAAAFSPAYFLGHHERKFKLLEDLKPNMESSRLVAKNITVVFYTAKNASDIKLEKATASVLPVLMHSCPENFNTVEYFENLATSEIGRLLVYANVLTSSMHIVNASRFANGFAVISCSQTQGIGRNENHWISPPGCLMASIQLHIPLASNLGQRLSIIQHLIATAILNALYSIPDYKDLDIGIKWPNDIYHRSKLIKMGGLVVTSQINRDEAVCNIGFGINYSNSKPTISINDLLLEKQSDKSAPTKLVSNEKMIAFIFNEIEKLINVYQTENPKVFFDNYYKYWMHSSNSDVEILDKNGYTKQAHIMGIDEYGFLTVKESLGTIQQVQPDGNSFDMLLGLISSK